MLGISLILFLIIKNFLIFLSFNCYAWLDILKKVGFLLVKMSLPMKQALYCGTTQLKLLHILFKI